MSEEVKPEAPESPPVDQAVTLTAGTPFAWRNEVKTPDNVRVIVPFVLILFCVVGLFAGLVLLLRQPVEPLFLSLPIGEYSDPAWPVNPWADQDADLLVPVVGSSDARGLKCFSFQQADRLRALLDWIGGQGDSVESNLRTTDRRRPLILHISSLAATRGGEVFILAGNADSRGDPTLGAVEGWLNVRDILTSVANWPTREKLLILDIAHPIADPFGGQLRNDIAIQLDKLLKEVAPAFPVLTSCGPGEVSLPADAARCSIFAFYLAEGLARAADGYSPPHDRDGFISAKELELFVSARIDRWARATGMRHQTPTLYGSHDLLIPRKPTAANRSEEPAITYPEWLKDAWTVRDATSRKPGLPFARLNAGLLLAEERWLHPGPTTRAEDVLASTREQWEDSGRGISPPNWASLDAVAAHLAVARLGQPSPSPELIKAFDSVLAAKPEQIAEAEKGWSAIAKRDRASAVQLVWDLAKDTNQPTADMIARWAKLATLADTQAPLVETQLLSTLAAKGTFRRQKLASYPANAVSVFVLVEDELGHLLALGPTEFGVGRELSQSALRDFRDGRIALFRAENAEQVASATLLLNSARANLIQARQQIERARESRRALADAVVVLGFTLTGMTEFNRPSREEWLLVANTALDISSGPLARAEPTAVATLARGVAKLRQPFDAKTVESLAGKDRQVGPGNCDHLRELLAGPMLVGKDRKVAWDALQADLAALHTLIRKQDESDNADGVRTPTPSPHPIVDLESSRALRRAEASLKLLQLVGSPDTARGMVLLGGAKAGDRKSWEELGQNLKAAWSDVLPATLSNIQRNPVAADRTLQALPPGLTRYPGWAVELGVNRDDDFTDYRKWIAELARINTEAP